MQTVSASADIEAPPEVVRDELTPRSIIEYEQTYDVVEVTETVDGWYLTVMSVEGDIEMELFFEELSNGFAYELVSGRPFERLRTTVTLDSDAPADAETGDDTNPEPGTAGAERDNVRVTMTSEFSFGGLLSPLTDWLASDKRQLELERALYNLGVDVYGVEPGSETDATSAERE